MFNREAAFSLFKEYNSETWLFKHALTMEALMMYFAEKQGENLEFWGMVGLLHDLDWEKYPEQHCIVAPTILRKAGAPEKMIHAICSHCWGYTTNVKPESYMEQLLYATDELSGIVAAAARLLPSGRVCDLKLSSLRKKYRNEKFAAGCDRKVIAKGAEMIGMNIDDLIEQTLIGLSSIEDGVNKKFAEIFPTI